MANTSYSLVVPPSTVLYDDDEDGTAEAGDDWGNPSAGVAAFDAHGRADELEDEDLVEHMQREVEAYRRGVAKRAAATARATPPRRPMPIEAVYMKSAERKVAKAAAERTERQRAAEELEEEQEERRRRMLAESGPSVEAGARLHGDAVGRQRRLQERAARHQEEAARQEQTDCSFKPSISAYAKAGGAGGDQRRPLVERLYPANQDRNVQRSNAKHDQEQRELAGCTFKPETSVGTKRLAADGKVARAPADDRLYRESEARNLRQKLREKHVGEWAKADAVGGRTITQEEADAAVERMYSWQRHKDEFLTMLRDEAAKPEYSVHANTAQVVARLTTPIVHGDANCDDGLHRHHHHHHQLQQQQQGGAEGHAPFVSSRSEQLAAHHREGRFAALFRALDVHDLGTLSLSSLDSMVALLEPHNVSILAALRSAGIRDGELILPDRFAEVLDRYERRFGPQAWSAGGRRVGTRFVSDEEANSTFRPQIAPLSATGLGFGGAAAAGTTVPTPIRGDGQVHERLFRQAARREALRDQVAREADRAARTATAAARPSITPRGAAAAGRALRTAPGHCSTTGTQQRSASGRARSADRSTGHHSVAAPRSIDEMSDVLLAIEDTLVDEGFSGAEGDGGSARSASAGRGHSGSRRRQQGSNDAAKPDNSAGAAAAGLPPRSPVTSRPAARPQTSANAGPAPAAAVDDAASAFDVAYEQMMGLQAARRKQQQQQQQEHGGGGSGAFPGQPHAYNMPPSVYEFFHPVSVSTARSTVHDRRGPPKRPDLREYGRDLMRQQLDETETAMRAIAATSQQQQPTTRASSNGAKLR